MASGAIATACPVGVLRFSNQAYTGTPAKITPIPINERSGLVRNVLILIAVAVIQKIAGSHGSSSAADAQTAQEPSTPARQLWQARKYSGWSFRIAGRRCLQS